MGLMDRDYYREKPQPRKEGILEKIRKNPVAVVIVLLLLLILISYIL